MVGYAFITNGRKPTKDKYESREPVILSNFSIPCIEAAIKMGYEVYFGTNRRNPEELECAYPVHLFDAHTYRSITAVKDNIVAYYNFSKIVKKGNIKVIHCNTPIGGMIGRFVGRKYHVEKIIYTAHGFHFFKGAPVFNRSVLKWAEQIMARWTNVIITMNEEDYQAALKFKLRKGGKVYKVHGVGITLDDFKGVNVDRKTKRAELGLNDTDIVCISAGDLVARKNYSVAIEALEKTGKENIHYLICGVGPERDTLEKLAKDKGILNRVHFLGFRTDVKELMAISDIFLFTTRQEGMPRSMMEAMACGLPCIASRIRGNVDLLDEEKGGYLRDTMDSNGFAECLKELADNESLRKKMSEYNLEAIKEYDVEAVKNEIEKIYKENL